MMYGVYVIWYMVSYLRATQPTSTPSSISIPIPISIAISITIPVTIAIPVSIPIPIAISIRVLAWPAPARDLHSHSLVKDVAPVHVPHWRERRDRR